MAPRKPPEFDKVKSKAKRRVAPPGSRAKPRPAQEPSEPDFIPKRKRKTKPSPPVKKRKPRKPDRRRGAPDGSRNA